MRYFFLVFVATIATGCLLSFNFKTDISLHKKYQFSQKEDKLKFFYNVESKGKANKIILAVKNTSNMYISNMSLYINTKNSKEYIYIGNIKNLSSKEFEFNVPADASKIKLKYKYDLVPEDIFLNPASSDTNTYSTEESTVLYVR